MTSTHAIAGKRKLGRTKVVAMALATTILTLGAVGSTYALWDDAASPQPAGTITSGNLDIALDGATEWTEISSDVPAAPQVIDANTFLATPGDTFRVRQRFMTTLDGENLRAKITVDWTAPPVAPSDVVIVYRILAQNAAPLSTFVPAGTPTVLDDLPGVDTNYILDVKVTYRPIKPDLMSPAVETTQLGNIQIDLDQIRSGTGYVP